MAKFFQNLRAIESPDQSNPDEVAYNDVVTNSSTNNRLAPTINTFGRPESPLIRRMREDSNLTKDIEERRQWGQLVGRLTEQTEPLRKEIREASGGKIIVDRSIYDKKALERILRSVKAMQKNSGGNLMPGYTVISNAKKLDNGSLGEAWSDGPMHFSLIPGVYWNLPRDHYGTANAPYRVNLQNANSTELTDYFARNALDSGWTIEHFNDDNVESAVQSHELAHTAYYDALNKTQNPALASNYQKKARIENFRQTHPSLQEIFDIAARNTGYDTVKDAAATVSKYALQDAEKDAKNGGLNASKNWSPNYHRLPELFAEAYNDYIYNGAYASDYSKELIRLYVNYVKDYNKTFENKIDLDQWLLPYGLSNNRLIDNMRKTSFQNGR